MIAILARMILAKVLTDPSVKKVVIDELKALAAKTDSTWDDEAVARVDEAWSVVVPAVVRRRK